MSNERTHLKEVKADDPLQVKKPSKLDQCKSTLDPSIPGIEVLITALPHCRISDVNDWVRLHPNDKAYWSTEYCFVNVPIVGQKRDTLHLVFEDLAKRFLPSKIVKRFRLVLATKPHDVFFLCEVPTRNLDNTWNETTCRLASRQRRVGLRQPAVKVRTLRVTMSPMPKMRMRSRSLIGRNSRSMNSLK
jgi:hypothetical protein